MTDSPGRPALPSRAAPLLNPSGGGAARGLVGETEPIPPTRALAGLIALALWGLLGALLAHLWGWM